jgi:CheY-like chemotaxis protein
MQPRSPRADREQVSDQSGGPRGRPTEAERLAEVGRLMLAKLGHQVDIVENGSDALDAVRRIPYDVILMDMHMPVMDGLEATRRIRAELPAESQPRIIALTASVTAQDCTACAEAGMDGYLAKPVRAAELSAALDPA